MAAISRCLWAALKAIILFVFFALIMGVVSGVILTFLGHEDGPGQASFPSGVVAIASAVAGTFAADAALRTAFKSQYPRRGMLMFVAVLWLLGVLLDVVFEKDSIFSTQHLRFLATTGTALFVLSRSPKTMISTSREPHQSNESFGAGIAKMAGGAATVLPMFLFLLMGIVQFSAVFAQVHAFTRVPGFIAGVLALALALSYFPFLGSVIGFFGAKDVWHWAWWQAALLYFGMPICIIALSVLGALLAAVGESLSRGLKVRA